MNKKELALLVSLIITTVISVLSGQIYEAETIRANTLRLHIIANSDSKADQQQKLYIKEKLLVMDDILPTEAQNIDQAVSVVKGNLPVIEARINTLLQNSSAGYKASCSIEDYYFDTTAYENFVLPQGKYTALTVRLGKAEGKNWWCVMYPALCSRSCGKTELENSSGFIKAQKPSVRFKVVEIYENLKNKFETNTTEKYGHIG